MLDSIRGGPTPNQVRIIYDMFASLTASAFIILIESQILKTSPSLVVLLAFIPLIVLNYLLGIFTHARVASALHKAVLLSISLGATSLLIYLLSNSALASILWLGLAWSPIVLPRILFNLDTRNAPRIINSTIRSMGPILVTGGAGYIGTHVVKQLLEQGEKVRVLDNLLHGRDSIDEFLHNPRFELIQGDATDIRKLTEAMNGVSAVVHLAGLVGDPACAVDERFTRHTNIIATRMISEVAKSMSIPRFVFASSCSVYGSSESEVDESSPLNPVSLYARTKIDSELELLAAASNTFCTTVLRFATVFGHSRRPRFDLVANLFVAQGFNEGRITLTGEQQWRPFVHVEDLARAIVMVLKANERKIRGQVFNVGDSKLNITIGQLAEKVRELLKHYGREVQIVRNPDVTDRRNYFVNFNKIAKVLGFSCSHTLDSGLMEIIEQFDRGAYQHHASASYSNLELTRKALEEFRDPINTARLYHPVSEAILSKVGNS